MGNTPSKGNKSKAAEPTTGAAEAAPLNERRSRLKALPEDVLIEIDEFSKGKLAMTNKGMHSLFHKSNIHAKFLECVAYGQQDKAERLLGEVFSGQPEKIQAALLHQGTFTDYSGRTFNCSAYEYAYWAKDTHMCRMLAHYMDDATKAAMLTRIDANDGAGLPYQQNGVEHRSANFDFKPLKDAYQRYLEGYDAWMVGQQLRAMEAAWLDVGKAQRNVPAHVAQEYCRPDRAFSPCPSFNESTLPRVLIFHDFTVCGRRPEDSWFPLTSSNSGLGFDFGLWRVGAERGERVLGCWLVQGCWRMEVDWHAINNLDEVRTAQLTQLREDLKPPAASHRLGK